MRFRQRSVLIPITLLLCAAPDAGAGEFVSRCPEGTSPIRTADAKIPWACVLKDARYQDGTNCPKDHFPVTTTDQFNPFKCAVRGIDLKMPRGICPPGHSVVPTSDSDRDYDCEKIKKGFQSGPRCPRGTIPVPTPGAFKPFRCIRREKGADTVPTADPDFDSPATRNMDSRKNARTKVVDCPKGTRKIRTENPFDPVQCVKKESGPVLTGGYKRFNRRGEMSFLYPKNWHLTDAWNDDVPTIFLVADTGRDGRPISLTISRQKRGSPSFLDMKTMIQREKEWHGAIQTAGDDIAGMPVVYLGVPDESRTAFLETGDGYYALAFSASEEMFADYLPVYEKVLKSFRPSGMEAE